MQPISAQQIGQRFQRDGAAFPKGLRDDYGDIVVTKGRVVIPPLYFIFDPDQVHTLLVNQADSIEKPGILVNILKSSFGNGIFTSGGTLWKRQRKLMQPVFHHARIGKFAEQMVTHTEAFLKTWQDGALRILDADMRALTLTIVVDALFTSDVSDETAMIGQAMHSLAAGIDAQGGSALLAFLPDWIPLPSLRRKRQGVAAINRTIYHLIQERRAAGEDASPKDLLSALVFAKDAETGDQMADGQVRDEVMTLFIAGHETTAVLLGWIWVLLAKHPEVEAKLLAELQTVLGGRAPTLADLPNLTYTQQIVKETLRLYPPVWMVMRQTREAITVGMETVPRRAIVFTFPYTTQHDERWFSEPERFQPERWENDFEKSLPKGVYYPFGMGPRVCIGNGFAMMEAQLLLATMAQRFHIELCSEANPAHSFTTLAFAQPVQVRLQARQ